MSESLKMPAFGLLHDISIVPSAHIPRGYRRTQGDMVSIHPTDYDLLKPMSATAALVALGGLREIGEIDLSWRTIETPPGGYSWEKLDAALEAMDGLMKGKSE